MTGKKAGYEIYSQDELKQMDEISKQISKERLLQIIYALSELENNMKWSSQKTVLFEVEMIKLCSPQENTNTSGLEDITARLNNLENKINSGNIKVAVQQSTEPKEDKKFDKSVGKVHIEQVSNLNIEKLPFWNKIIEQLKQDRKMLLASNLLNTVATMLNDMTVGIVFQNGLTPFVKSIMENENIKKYSYGLNEMYVILEQNGILLKGIEFDAEIAAYILNPSNNHYKLEELASQYLNIDISEYLEAVGANQEKETQMTLFSQEENNIDFEKYHNAIYTYVIAKLIEVMEQKMQEISSMDLFKNIEMPLVKVLAEMQYEGIYVDKEELISFGDKLKEEIESIKQEIYNLSGEEFNINSTQQLGVILFEKLKLPVYKKTKKGYSTDVDILEKLKPEHPVIEKILEYRTLMKLDSTYIDGLIVYINEYTKKIHSYFHQTVTATGRISSTEPNLQNIPTRAEQGKQIKKAFKAQKGNIFIDADYSQIELRILAHISKDKNMREAFLNEEDIHKQVASKVFDVPLEEVTKEQRTAAKAVNFGIVYGISGFGLAEQLGISRKKAEQYIEQYLNKYCGVKQFMDEIVEEAKQNGYVETLFHRRRYIPELSSNNYMVRQFGARAAMNTPIQGTAADIMKIAMIHVNERLKEEKLNARLILQIHDELLIECNIEEKEKVKEILKESMEKAVKLEVPLEVEVSEATDWYDVK